jgi:hypothetical protein
VNIPVESPSPSIKSLRRQRFSWQSGARIQDSAGGLIALARRGSKKSAKKSNAMLRCDCQHAKSIHSRMYANQNLGTSCNFPGCRCKAYNPARD